MPFKHRLNTQAVPNPVMHNQTPQVRNIRAPNKLTVRAIHGSPWSTVLHVFHEQAQTTKYQRFTHQPCKRRFNSKSLAIPTLLLADGFDLTAIASS